MSNSNQWWFHWIIRTLQINSLRFDVSLHTIKKKKKESIPLDHVITSYRPLLFKGLYISLASVFVFLLLCVDISQRAKPSRLMLQIRNTLRRLWQISARLGCQIKKKWRSRGAEYWNSSHSIQMQTVSLGIFTIRDKSNTTEADPPFFFLFIQANSIGMNLKQHVLADSTGGSLSPTCTHTLLSSLPGRCHKYWKYFLSHWKKNMNQTSNHMSM